MSSTIQVQWLPFLVEALFVDTTHNAFVSTTMRCSFALSVVSVKDFIVFSVHRLRIYLVLRLLYSTFFRSSTSKSPYNSVLQPDCCTGLISHLPTLSSNRT